MRLTFIVTILFGLAGPARAAFDADGRMPDSWPSEAVYKASHTASVSTNVDIATNTKALLKAVVVNTVGASSKLELFNSHMSTTVDAVNTRIADINTSSTTGTFTYDLELSSGLQMYNQGSPPADITLIYWDFSENR